MKDIIIPFCIYHYIYPSTKTYWGYIGVPQKILRDDGTTSYRCTPEPKVLKNWFHAGTFYAVSPSFRPVPAGMKIFCAKKSIGFPYVTEDVSNMYDIYNMKNDCVYFTTFSKPSPNTVPLYFHMIGNTVFPSFDKYPPSSDPDWKQTKISPVFVMTVDTVGDITDPDHKGIKFNCNNGRCLPWTKEISNVFDIDPYPSFLDFSDCVFYCNELTESEGSGEPRGILEVISSKEKRKPVVSRFFKKLPPLVIAAAISIFIVLIFIIIYTAVQKKNEIGRI
mgnify:CR=1 FL=1